MTKKANEKKLNWNLEDIFPINQFDEKLNKANKEIDNIENHYHKLSPDMKTSEFKKTMHFLETLNEEISKINYLPFLMESLDQKDEKAKLLKIKARDIHVNFAKNAEKINQWISGKKVPGKKILDEKNAKRLFSTIPDLEYILSYKRTAAKHTLPEEQENIILQKDSISQEALIDLREYMETEFVFSMQTSKDKKPLKINSASVLKSYTHSSEPDKRKAAYISLLGKYKENIEKFFIIYQAVVKNWVYESNLRGYESPLSMRNFANHIPDKAIDTMLDVSVKNKDIFQNYFKWKAKALGKKKINRFDLYAPLNQKNKKIKIDEAVKTVLKTFEDFSPGFKEKAELIINSSHLDAYPSGSKQDGAFCATVSPSIIPYVLMNYTGRARDVATLAHELGHGIHSLYANDKHPSSQHANLPLSETASTLGELILFEKMLSKEKDKAIKKTMLAEKMDDSYATILRQNYFVRFEIKAHELITKGSTSSELSKLWLETLKEQFGESVNVDPIFKYEWAYIPHIVHTPFYCYAYNFGELLSLSLFQKYKEEGSSFVPKIEKILSYGGSRDPQKVLEEIGIDINSPDFWNEGFEVIRNWQKELESI